MILNTTNAYGFITSIEIDFMYPTIIDGKEFTVMANNNMVILANTELYLKSNSNIIDTGHFIDGPKYEYVSIHHYDKMSDLKLCEYIRYTMRDIKNREDNYTELEKHAIIFAISYVVQFLRSEAVLNMFKNEFPSIYKEYFLDMYV